MRETVLLVLMFAQVVVVAWTWMKFLEMCDRVEELHRELEQRQRDAAWEVTVRQRDALREEKDG